MKRVYSEVVAQHWQTSSLHSKPQQPYNERYLLSCQLVQPPGATGVTDPLLSGSKSMHALRLTIPVPESNEKSISETKKWILSTTASALKHFTLKTCFWYSLLSSTFFFGLWSKLELGVLCSNFSRHFIHNSPILHNHIYWMQRLVFTSSANSSTVSAIVGLWTSSHALPVFIVIYSNNGRPGKDAVDLVAGLTYR